MNKNELIEAIADKSGLTKKDSKAALEATLETITEVLSNKGEVSLIGFGTFKTVKKDARIAKVPGTNKTVEVPATTGAKFKVGKALKDAVAKA